jgi:hypothetical protein
VTGPEFDVYADTEKVLRLALHDDRDAVAGTFSDVVSRSGIAGAHDVAVCLVATIVGEDVRPGTWSLEFPGIDSASYDKRWVARLVSAYVNADPPTVAALFGAAEADGQLPACLLTLAGSAAATLRNRAAPVDPETPATVPPYPQPIEP